MFASISPVQGRRAAAIAGGCMLLLLAGCGGGMSYSGGAASAGNTMPGGATGSSMPAPAGDMSGTTGAAMGAGTCNAASCGSALITLTDAKGDFLSYIVSLTSLQLQTADGTTVETIPATTKVDFAQLVDLAEVLSAGQIPAAEYVSAKLTIDYTNAEITADDGTGTPVELKPVDSSGAAITGPLTVNVQLDKARHLRITSGQIGRLALDFNLGVSNVVDLTADTVTVAPTLVASLAPPDVKPIRVRGSLGTVSTDQDTFVVDVLPFHDEDSTTGVVTVHVDGATTYEIDGKAYTGDAGIAALGAASSGIKIAAFGTLQSGVQPTFTAKSILAGTSLESPREDRISGTVVARNQMTLTVRAATWSGSDGDFDFERQDATVTVGPGTAVTEEGHAGAFSVADISVGQRIEASGTASKASGGSVSLDATAGQVRLDVTAASGIVTHLANGSLTFNLQSLGGLPASVFDFLGTGSSAASDADPAAYLVDTGALTQPDSLLNSPAQVLGFVTGFGMAPPDFAAETLVTAPSVEAELQIRFDRSGSTMAFIGLAPASASLVIDLSSIANHGGDDGGDGNVAPIVHDESGGNNGGGNDGGGNEGGDHGSSGGNNDGNNGNNAGGNGDGDGPFIEIGPQRIDVRQLATLIIVADGGQSADPVFTLGHAGSRLNVNFSVFSDFVAQLANDLASRSAVVALTASGRFDAASGTFTATHIAVLLTD